MLVEVGCDARSRNRSLIHAKVESLSARHSTQGLHCLLGKHRNFISLWIGKFGEISNMPIRANQQMPRVVGIQIQNNVGQITAVGNKIKFLAPLQIWGSAKRARIRVVAGA